MNCGNRDTAIQKIKQLSDEQVSKVLIFIAGMKAEQIIAEEKEAEKSREPPVQMT